MYCIDLIDLIPDRPDTWIDLIPDRPDNINRLNTIACHSRNRFQITQFGFLDKSGNEWCWDTYHQDHWDVQTGGSTHLNVTPDGHIL